MNDDLDLDLDRDRDVDELVDAAEEDARYDVDAEISPPLFASIVARAHRIDPQAVDTTQVQASQWAHVPVSPAARADDPECDGFIDMLVAAARQEAESDAEAGRQRPIPRMPAPPSSSRRFAVAIGAGLLLAAVAVLAIGLRPTLSMQLAGDDSKSQAVAEHDKKVASQRATPWTESEPKPKPKPKPRPKPRAEPSAAPLPEPVVDSETIVPDEPAPLEVEPHPPKPRTPKPETRNEKLGRLDAQARRLLAAGKLGDADRALGELVDRGGSHRLVEAAYGDRFTIAHRQGAKVRQQQLWRAYLKRFPRGRFADDARAGLCRRAGQSESRGCWAAYLRDFPSGTYRNRAERILEGG